MTPREEFLKSMYEQLWSNISRHVMISWQAIATLIAAIGVMALVEKEVLPLDCAVALIVFVCAWASLTCMTHLIGAVTPRFDPGHPGA